MRGSTGGEHLAAPVVGITASPGGPGVWLVGADGGVFRWAFFGSTGGPSVASPMVAASL